MTGSLVARRRLVQPRLSDQLLELFQRFQLRWGKMPQVADREAILASGKNARLVRSDPRRLVHGLDF